MEPPTAMTVSVWPTPHSAPIKEASLIVRWRATMVVTAMTWSGSVAWRIPKKKPSAMMESKLIIASKDLYSRPHGLDVAVERQILRACAMHGDNRLAHARGHLVRCPAP